MVTSRVWFTADQKAEARPPSRKAETASTDHGDAHHAVLTGLQLPISRELGTDLDIGQAA